MKKQLLLKHRGIFLALLSFLCVTSIQAQTWTPPTFEHQTNDLSSHVGEVFYLYNVGLNAYVTYGADYGTRAVMGPVGYPMYLRASGSNYKFEFVTSCKHNGATYDLWHAGGGTVYTDNTNSSDWTCTYDATSKSYTVANTAAAASTYLAPSSTTYSNTPLNTAGNGFKNGGKYYILWDNIATNDNYAKWRFVTPKQKALLDLSNLFTYVTNNPSLGITLTSYVDIYNNSLSTTTDLTTDLTNLKNAIYAIATTSNPVEITSFAIANPSFEFISSGSMDSWVVTPGSLQPQYNVTFSSGKSGSVEYYSGTGNIPAFTIQQTINSLPAGKYSLSTNLTGSTGTGTTSPANIKLFAGSYNTSITTTPTPTPAIYSVQNILTPSDGSSLNIGLQYTTGAAWLAADYFKLYYYGPITSSTTWNSSTSTWSNGTPTVDVNAVIPSGNTYNGPGFTCYSLDVEEATTFTSAATINSNLTLNNTLTVSEANTLTIGGIVSGASTITATSGTVAYAGSSAQTISNLNGGAVYNLTVNNAAGATLGASTTVSGTLTLTNGNLSTGANTLSLTASGTPVSGSGNIVTGSTGTVAYAGSASQTISNLNGTTVNLTVNNSAGVKLGADFSFNNIALTLGNLIANGKNFTITGSTSGAGSIDCSGTAQSVHYAGTSAQTISNIASAGIYNMSVDNTAGATLATNLTIRCNLALNSGNLNTGAYTLTLSGGNSSGTVPTQGSYNIVTGSTGTVAYTGGSQQVTNLNGTVYNLTTNTATLMAATTVSGTLTLNSGTLTNTNTLTLANGATIVRSTGTLSAVPTFGTTVNVNYTGAVTTGNELPTTASTLNNLTVGAAVTLNAASTVNGTLTLSSNLTTGSNTLTLTKAGTPTTGSGSILTGSTGTVVYAGSLAQTISNLNGAVYNLTINNAAGVTLADNLTASNILTINSGAALSVAAGKQLTATSTLTNSGTLNLLSTSDGTATILTPASIGGTGGAVNVQQYLTGADANTDGKPDGRYWYLTSPVVGSTSNAFTPATNYLWSYSETGNSLETVYTRMAADASLAPGTGYVARMAANGNISLSGTSLFNEDITFTNLGYASATKQGFNLIGNPYPCYLDIRAAFTDATGIETSAWYRSSTDGLSNVFDTFNASSGASIAISSGVNTASLAIIPPMQAFWVRATNTTNSLTFSKTTRSHKPATNGNNLRSAATSDVKQIRLNVSNGTNTDQTLIGFYAQAMDEFDNCDSRKMFNGVANLPEIYSLAGSTIVAINGLPLLTDTREIALGFKTAQAGSFTIKAAEILNLEEGQTVILKDKLQNVTQNLTETPEYSFTSTVTNTTDRFSLVIGKVATALATVNNPVFAVCTTNGNMLEVALSGVNTNAARITVFNALGQELASFKASGSKTVIGKRFESGVYVVKVVAPGFQATRKVIINN